MFPKLSNKAQTVIQYILLFGVMIAIIIALYPIIKDRTGGSLNETVGIIRDKGAHTYYWDEGSCTCSAQCGVGVWECPDIKCMRNDGVEVDPSFCAGEPPTYHGNPCTGYDCCGNGVVDSGEDCDGEDLNGETCESLHPGFTLYQGSLSCDEDCKFVDECAWCGDGELNNPPEMCDGTQFFENRDCSFYFSGYSGSGVLSCTDNCNIDTSTCTFCGDGHVDPDEDCDSGVGTLDCSDFEVIGLPGIYYHAGGNLKCFPQGDPLECTLDFSECEYCGDGTINGSPNPLDDDFENCEEGDVDYTCYGEVSTPPYPYIPQCTLAGSGGVCVDEKCDGGIVTCNTCVWDYTGCTCTNFQPVLLGTYEMSYIYNSMNDDGGPCQDCSPQGSINYAGTSTTPREGPTLGLGQYQLKLVAGRETSGSPVDKLTFDAVVPVGLDSIWNSLVLPNNPGAPKYESGFDGGNNWPNGNPEGWYFGTWFWVGSSVDEGTPDTIQGGVGVIKDFRSREGDKIWFYATDWFIDDNLGGSTTELWQLSEPQP